MNTRPASPIAFVMILDQESADILQCWQDLRKIYKTATLIIRFDGEEGSRVHLPALQQDPNVRILEEPRLSSVDHGGLISQRMLELMLETGADIILKIDADTQIRRALRWLPDPSDASIWGSLQQSGQLQSLRGGCMIFTRTAVRMLLESGLLLCDQLKAPHLAWCAGKICTQQAFVMGLTSIEWTIAWAARQLGISLNEHAEVLGAWRYHRLSSFGDYYEAAVVHPHLSWASVLSWCNLTRMRRFESGFSQWRWQKRSDFGLNFSDFDAWNLPIAAINWIVSHTEPGSRILELGSGRSTRELSKLYYLTSVEEKPGIDMYDGVDYCLAPIKDGWYDPSCVDTVLSASYDVVIVDGPYAGDRDKANRRLGFLKHWHRLDGRSVLVVDDIHRPFDLLNFVRLWWKRRSGVVLIFDGNKACGVLHDQGDAMVALCNLIELPRLLIRVLRHVRR